MQRNKQHIGARYIDLFHSDEHEYNDAVRRMGVLLPRADPMKPVAAPRVPGASPRFEKGKGNIQVGRGNFDFGKGQTIRTPSECVDGVVKLRGLPFQCTAVDVAKLYEEFGIDETVVYMMLHVDGLRVGQQNGDAYVRFTDVETAEAAIKKCNRKLLEKRYVEMFPASENELSGCAAEGGIVGYESNNPRLANPGAASASSFARPRGTDVNVQVDREGSGWLRLRGLPYQATQSNVAQFFGLANMDVPDEDVTIKYGSDGRPSGEAFVQLESPELAALAAQSLHRQSLGGRYIEVFSCSYQDSLSTRHNRPTPYASSRHHYDHYAAYSVAPYIVSAPTV